MTEPGSKPFWAKCLDCGHTWAAAFYPMELAKFAALAQRTAICPKCASTRVVVAKQNDGVLQEPAA